MIYLLDTHYLIWVVSETKMLSGKIKDILANPEDKIIISTISLWEIALKYSIGKLELEGGTPEDIPIACLEMGFEIRELSATDTSTYHHLKADHHKDPFDRMLIWQAINNNYTLITADSDIKKYVSEGLKVYRE